MKIRRPSSETTGGKLCGWYTSTRSLPGKLKPAGATPTTTLGRPSMLTVSPTTDGSPPKRRIQNSWLSTTTPSSPGCSSAATKPRPAANGSLVSSEKNPAVTMRVTTRSGSPRRVRFWSRDENANAATASSVVARSRHAKKEG